ISEVLKLAEKSKTLKMSELNTLEIFTNLFVVDTPKHVFDFKKESVTLRFEVDTIIRIYALKNP
ncbi:MAG: hypothetical protein KAR85_06335, partial [Methanosarcinales archaeon]|nr:hypothetical protein [Methanosarcinales archaeon]